MVEQRSPKPLVACSNHVSPAKQKRIAFCNPFFVFELFGKAFDDSQHYDAYKHKSDHQILA